MLLYLLIACGWLIVGEALTALTALVAPATLRSPRGFAWYWASLRVLLWPLVLLFVCFYALSIPIQIVWSRQKSNEPTPPTR